MGWDSAKGNPSLIAKYCLSPPGEGITAEDISHPENPHSRIIKVGEDP